MLYTKIRDQSVVRSTISRVRCIKDQAYQCHRQKKTILNFYRIIVKLPPKISSSLLIFFFVRTGEMKECNQLSKTGLYTPLDNKSLSAFVSDCN